MSTVKVKVRIKRKRLADYGEEYLRIRIWFVNPFEPKIFKRLVMMETSFDNYDYSSNFEEKAMIYLKEKLVNVVKVKVMEYLKKSHKQNNLDGLILDLNRSLKIEITSKEMKEYMDA
ncbi:hypothetical protein ABEO76_21665 [Bacillus anthracis]|uniref:hypothetical protein n=1 Tax=Bacillus anthracis TaxID=1392 RepID=UPI003D1F143E